MVRYGILIFALLSSMLSSAFAGQIFGTIKDAKTGHPISGVELRSADATATSDNSGCFIIYTDHNDIVVRKPGYLPQQVTATSSIHLQLQPFSPRALYLSYWAADSDSRRNNLQELITKTSMNALVIDLKSSRGDIAFRSNVPLARTVGALKVRTLKDLPEFLTTLKRQGIYTIGRIVVFKDDALAKNREDIAIHTAEGDLWQDREKISWTDPFQTEVWDYNIAIAKEAAALGFDEIQFDYIRFPAKSNLQFSQTNTGENRVAAVNGFLQQAKQQLAPYPVMISANIFGYTCWKHKDQKIGQRLVDLAQHVDYLSPMLYPSGFPDGIPGYSNPIQHPYEVVAHSLQRAIKNTGLPAVRFRPWLQAFKDYAFDRRKFGIAEISPQINASDTVGSHGWMLWNAASRFSLAGLPALKNLNIAEGSAKEKEPATLTQTPKTKEEYPLL